MSRSFLTAQSMASISASVEAAAPEHLQRVQLRLRGHPRSDEEPGVDDVLVVRSGVARTVEPDPRPGGRARDVRAVSVAVQRVGVRLRGALVLVGWVVVIADEVPAAHDPGGGECARLDDRTLVAGVLLRVAPAAEIGVVVVDTAVDDADAYPGTGRAQVLPHLRGSDEGHRAEVVDLSQGDPVDTDDARQAGELGRASRGDPHPDPVVRVLELRVHRAAEPFDVGHDHVLGRVEGRGDLSQDARRELTARIERVGLDHRDRRALQLDHDRDQTVRIQHGRDERGVDGLERQPLHRAQPRNAQGVRAGVWSGRGGTCRTGDDGGHGRQDRQQAPPDVGG